MSETTTTLVGMTRLADQGELGGIMVRLMLVIQDFALANHAHGVVEGRKGRKVQAPTYRGRPVLPAASDVPHP
jgi:hypothetical protein